MALLHTMSGLDSWDWYWYLDCDCDQKAGWLIVLQPPEGG